MTVQSALGLVAQGKTKAVFIRRIRAAKNVRHHPLFKDKPAAEIDAANFAGHVYFYRFSGVSHHAFPFEQQNRPGHCRGF